MPPFCRDPGTARGPRDIETAGGEGATEDDPLRVLADVHEAAHADDAVPEAADVDIAVGIDLGKGEEGDIEPAPVVEVELVRLVDHRAEVGGRPGFDATRRGAADQPLLVGQ